MRQMKEKLVKNHYKGFDRRAKAFSLASLGLLIVSACVFLPLTANVQARALQEQAASKTEIRQPAEKQAGISLAYADQVA